MSIYRSMLMLTLAGALAAQQGPATPPPPFRPPPEGQILAQFYQLRVARIQQTLGVSEDRARAMAERWGSWDRDLVGRGRQMLQLRAQFNQVLMGTGTEDEKCARVKPLVDQFLDLRQQQEEAKHRFEAEILRALSPAQQARMIILVEDIQGRIRETLREARRSGQRF